MIYGIDGEYGSGKSSFATYLANRISLNGNNVWTNIKMNKMRILNLFEFGDEYENLMEVLRTINALNDVERCAYQEEIPKSNLPYLPRGMFTTHNVFYDESGSNTNANDTKLQRIVDHVEYINQNRKNFMDLYLIGADGGENVKSLRRHVNCWLTSEPFMNLPILKHVKIIHREYRKEDGVTVKEKTYYGLDMSGDTVKKVRDERYYEIWYFQPLVWQLYNDLHKSIKDPMKYTGVNKEMFITALRRDKMLQQALLVKGFFQDRRFAPLHNLLLNAGLFNDDEVGQAQENGGFFNNRVTTPSPIGILPESID